METALGAASWLVGKVLNKLSDDLVAAYVASAELGLNTEQIKDDLMYTQGLLHAAKGRDNNPGLKGLLEQLSEKADEAEEALDELHYFMIQDQLDATQHAALDLGGDLQETVQHGRHAVCHTIGNWLPCLSCFLTQDGADIETPPTTIKSDTGNNGGHVDKLKFDRVTISTKIKSVIEVMHSKCIPVSDLLKISSTTNTTQTTAALKRPLIGSTLVQDKLYGRSVVFEQTIKDITSGTYHGEALSVLPIVGPGGIGKSTFTQHMYNDKRTEDHFTVRVWVCVSTEFDVHKLTWQIHSCIPPTEKEEKNTVSETTSLDQLQISIAHRLKSKRFLIVLDDVWKCGTDAEWDTLLSPFTKGEAQGSIVLVTTRFPRIGNMVSKATVPIHLKGLEPKEFLEFFQACIFGESKPAQKYNELIDIGSKIAERLKCSPLAAKTVARLLKKDLSWEHWRKVLENNDWQKQTHSDDIMPALKISYDYLPFHLKQCFPYFSLFPEDHVFKKLDMIRFWNAIGIIDSSSENNSFIEELVDSGFLMEKYGQYFVMHDLLHELSRNVSYEECANISSLAFSADKIPRTIRHLSVTIENRYDESFRLEMAKLKRRIDIGKLRTLMIFGRYEERICKILKDTFNEIEGLRVLFIAMESSESLPKNFSKLLHLRYLKLLSFFGSQVSLPSELSRFYHLIFLDLIHWQGSTDLPKSISHLLNLRHFIADSKLHSNVPEVGKMEHLEELREFHVKKESVGFELEELGKLLNLGGELRVCNLEKVSTKDEASKAKLALKRDLKMLTLVWGTEQLAADADVIDGLQPHDSLRELTIVNQIGAIPSWLCRDISITHLESLTLKGVSWGTLPPFGQLPYLRMLVLNNIAGVHLIVPDSGTCRDPSFMHLKKVVFINMPDLEKLSVEPTCPLFPVIESIECRDCPNLLALPFFPDCSLSCTQDIHCPSLDILDIRGCPKLLLPPMPHALSVTNIYIHDDAGELSLEDNRLTLKSYTGAVALHNMSKIQSLMIEEGSIHLKSMDFLSSFTSLSSLELFNCENITVDELNPLNLKVLGIGNDKNHTASVAVDLLSEVARGTKQFPAGSFQLEKLALDSISAVLVAPICSFLAATLHKLVLCFDQRVESLTEDEEKSLQLLTSLQTLKFEDCPGLPSLPQGLHSLSSLRKLKVLNCPEIHSLPKGGLPSSLYKIEVDDCSDELHEQVKKLEETNPKLQACTGTTTHIATACVHNLQVLSAYSSEDNTWSERQIHLPLWQLLVSLISLCTCHRYLNWSIAACHKPSPIRPATARSHDRRVTEYSRFVWRKKKLRVVSCCAYAIDIIVTECLAQVLAAFAVSHITIARSGIRNGVPPFAC